MLFSALTTPSIAVGLLQPAGGVYVTIFQYDRESKTTSLTAERRIVALGAGTPPLTVIFVGSLLNMVV